jgi:hypothetical protein
MGDRTIRSAVLPRNDRCRSPISFARLQSKGGSHAMILDRL